MLYMETVLEIAINLKKGMNGLTGRLNKAPTCHFSLFIRKE